MGCFYLSHTTLTAQAHAKLTHDVHAQAMAASNYGHKTERPMPDDEYAEFKASWQPPTLNFDKPSASPRQPAMAASALGAAQTGSAQRGFQQPQAQTLGHRGGWAGGRQIVSPRLRLRGFVMPRAVARGSVASARLMRLA